MIGIMDNQQTPIVEKIHQEALSLPISYIHTKENILKAFEVMNKY
jgi:hypothetical protein